MSKQLETLECVEVEKELLSGLMGSGDAIQLVLQERLTPKMFFLIRHEWIFEAMLELHRRGDEIDIMTVSEELERQGRLAEINAGENYLISIMAFRLGSYHFRTLAAFIRRMYERREMLRVSEELRRLAYDESQSIITAWSRAKRAIDDARPYEPNQNFTFGADTFEVYRQMMDDMREHTTSYTMPWQTVTSVYGEAQPGEMFGIIGPTGSGKSSALSTAAEFYAGEHGLRTAYIFTEMRLKKVLDRRLAKNSYIDYRRIKNPVEWTEGEQQMLLNAEREIFSWAHKLDYWHAPSPTASTLLANMRRMHTELGTSVFVIDHMNDIDVEEYDAGARNWVQFLIDVEAFCNETGSILWTAAQTNRDDGKAYMVGQAFDHKLSLVMELQPKELDHDFTLEYDGRKYEYRTGKNSPVVPIYFRKNREGGPARGELLFVGPRYLWADVPDGFSDAADDDDTHAHVYRGGER